MFSFRWIYKTKHTKWKNKRKKHRNYIIGGRKPKEARTSINKNKESFEETEENNNKNCSKFPKSVHYRHELSRRKKNTQQKNLLPKKPTHIPLKLMQPPLIHSLIRLVSLIRCVLSSTQLNLTRFKLTKVTTYVYIYIFILYKRNAHTKTH